MCGSWLPLSLSFLLYRYESTFPHSQEPCPHYSYFVVLFHKRNGVSFRGRVGWQGWKKVHAHTWYIFIKGPFIL